MFNLYSKQQKALKSRRVRFRHDIFPEALRNQVLTIFEKIFGRGTLFSPEDIPSKIYSKTSKILCHEYGIDSLLAPNDNHAIAAAIIVGGDVFRFFRLGSVDQCLDVIQVTLTVGKKILEAEPITSPGDRMSIEEGIAELNARFKEHGVGYRYDDGNILKLSSEFTFQYATGPAIQLLKQKHLAGANQEFCSAQAHFRHNRFKECLNDCLKAFESTMKAIAAKRGWPFSQTDTAKSLIRVCVENALFPVFMENHLTGLRTTLESGVPTARNKTSAHGQGVQPTNVSEEFATYILNLTAANILFLADSDRLLK